MIHKLLKRALIALFCITAVVGTANAGNVPDYFMDVRQGDWNNLQIDDGTEMPLVFQYNYGSPTTQYLGVNYYYQYNYYYYQPQLQINLPFEFEYDQMIWSKLKIAADGHLTFLYDDGSAIAEYPYGQSGYSYYKYYNRPAIYGQQYMYQINGLFWLLGEVESKIKYKTVGTSPNRQFVVQWEDHAGTTSYRYQFLNTFQIRLHEGTNIIEIVRGPSKFYTGTVYSSSYSRFVNAGLTGIMDYDQPSTYSSYVNAEHRHIYPSSNYSPSNPGASWSEHISVNMMGIGYYYSYSSYYHAIYPNYAGGFYWTYYRTTWADYPGIVFRYSAPSVEMVYPAKDLVTGLPNIFLRGIKLDGNFYPHPFAQIFHLPDHPAMKMTYKITGPLGGGNETIVYKAIDPVTGDDWIDIPSNIGVEPNKIMNFTSATGIWAMAGGGIDLSNPNNVTPGRYRVEWQMDLGGDITDYPYVDIIIALEDDLAVLSIKEPKEKGVNKYPLPAHMPGFPGVPMACTIINQGVSAISAVVATATVYDSQGNLIEPIFTQNLSLSPAMTTGQFKDINFGYFIPTEVDEYSIVFEAQISPDPLIDDELTNNILPRAGDDPHIFATSYEVELEVDQLNPMPYPLSPIYVNRPVVPVGKYRNNGVSDVERALADIQIIDETTTPPTIVYEDLDVEVLSIPAASETGLYNVVDVPFSKDWVPAKVGTFKVVITIKNDDDPDLTNNTATTYIQVVDGMAGNYTISANGSGERNFPTISDAVHTLYEQGITNDVNFILTDTEYVEGDPQNLDDPAIDFSAWITGIGEVAQVTFKPSALKSVQKAGDNSGVTIKIRSGSGIGFYFGQNRNPSDISAVINQNDLAPSKRRIYARPNGYVHFDGGNNKAIRFLVEAPAEIPQQIAIYLGTGSHNHMIKNCIFENNSDFVGCALPLTQYNQSSNGFLYEDDLRPDATAGFVSHSTAIVMRSKVPVDMNGSNSDVLDTLFNHNNIISGNDISGFAYGVASFGTGVLWNQGTAEYNKYYNENNLIANNIIHDVTKAGVFVGFELNTKIANNRIFNVTGDCSDEAVGIIAGGEGKAGWFGYNNINLVIDGNEISDVYAPQTNSVLPLLPKAIGIKVEQSNNSYLHPQYNNVYFPDVPENTSVINNIVRDLQVQKESLNANLASRFGIHMLTTRTFDNVTETERNYLPFSAGYMSRDDKVINNTVVINDDGGIVTAGALGAIVIQDLKDAKVMNNAIAYLDKEVDHTSNSSNVHAGIVYQGLKPNAIGSIKSNRNAFYMPTTGVDAADGNLFYFIETDDMGHNLEIPNAASYQSLRQWRSWTGQDINSIEGNWVADYVMTGDDDNEMFRVSTNPAPIGSILNNRGDILFDYLTTDIDGQDRGAADRRFDIGADEFDGRLYRTDVEILDILSPSAYQSAGTKFDDAEYIMTDEWDEVTVLLRNSGNISVTGVEVKMELFIENGNGYFGTTPDHTMIKNVDMLQAATQEVTYDGINDLLSTYVDVDGNTIPYVRTYSDIMNIFPAISWNIHSYFMTMKANVTPRYKVRIKIEADQKNVNNEAWGTYRFYLKQSNVLNTIVSGENTNAIVPDNMDRDQVAGRLNFDAMLGALEALGWFPRADRDKEEIDYLKIDLFDRSGWELKAVNYALYKNMIWTDGDDKPVLRLEKMGVENFLAAGHTMHKNNFVLGSQEYIRELTNNGENPYDPMTEDEYYVNIDANFANGVLRSFSVEPHNPQGFGGNNNGNQLIGKAVGDKLVEDIFETGFSNDDYPKCGLMSVFPQGEGLAQTAYDYTDHAASAMSGMGVATTTLRYNTIVLGVDWRHFDNIERVMRASLDFLEKNGAPIVPVELANFDAKARNNSVDVIWTTASEFNTDKFEVERANVIGNVNGAFDVVDVVKAAGNSSSELNYGITDGNVTSGNTYAYRLRMVDLDGNADYSEVRVVEISDALGVATPNPAISEVKFSTNSTFTNPSVVVFDMNGRRVNVTSSMTSNQLLLNVTNLVTGQYTVVVKEGDAQETRQFQVSK
jgi:type IX secretion system substrate protein